MVQPPAYQPSFYIIPILPVLRGAGMLLFGWRQWLLTHTQETDSRQPTERPAWLQLLMNFMRGELIHERKLNENSLSR